MIRIHVFHTGKVCVAPELPFGGEDCNAIKASGLFGKRKDRLWLPVSSYLIEHPKGLFLVDTGWERGMSPNGDFDRRAQIRSLWSLPLYLVNQGVVGKGECVDEQLLVLGIHPSDLDAVLLTHLDCDHANGIRQVKGAKKILVSADELRFAKQGLQNIIRYNPVWWKDTDLTTFEWTGTEGPAYRSYDLLGDGTIKLINIPGHSDGLFAVKVSNGEKFVLLYSDGGYATRSWAEMIISGISANKAAQKKSLAWIRDQSLDPNCVESMANHDPDIEPHQIEL